jgi:hypothetical protein
MTEIIEITVTLTEAPTKICEGGVSVKVLESTPRNEECGCHRHEGIDINALKVGDLIKVVQGPARCWNGEVGTIESFEVCKFGTQMMFLGSRGHLKGCVIEKICPKCNRVVNEFEF